MAFSTVTPFFNNGRRRWGAVETDFAKSWPGDDLVPEVKGEYMHAITINASAVVVWKWLIQLGQGRGGFYSYEFLENLVGCRMRNVDKIVPKLQRLKVGDDIPMHPKMGSPYKVHAMESPRFLLLLMRVDSQTGKSFSLSGKKPQKYQNQSWLLYLDEYKKGATRLISRSRNDWDDCLGNTIFYGLFGPLSIEMDRKMLKGIKQRSEAAVSTK